MLCTGQAGRVSASQDCAGVQLRCTWNLFRDERFSAYRKFEKADGREADETAWPNGGVPSTTKLLLVLAGMLHGYLVQYAILSISARIPRNGDIVWMQSEA